jgi:hypothetical protein
LRVHRSGGFTKDALYLSGLNKIYSRYQSGQSMDSLLLCNCSKEYEPVVDHLKDLGLIKPLSFACKSFETNYNNNPRVEWILENLK